MIKWPLYECITPETLVELAEYQYRVYGTVVEFFYREFPKVTMSVTIEPIEEIDKLMRQPPHYKESKNVQ